MDRLGRNMVCLDMFPLGVRIVGLPDVLAGAQLPEKLEIRNVVCGSSLNGGDSCTLSDFGDADLRAAIEPPIPSWILMP